MTLTPAYGRDYKSGKAAKADFYDNKDFIVADISDPDDGRYTNREDVVNMGIKTVNLRFKCLTKIAVVTV